MKRARGSDARMEAGYSPRPGCRGGSPGAARCRVRRLSAAAVLASSAAAAATPTLTVTPSGGTAWTCTWIAADGRLLDGPYSVHTVSPNVSPAPPPLRKADLPEAESETRLAARRPLPLEGTATLELRNDIAGDDATNTSTITVTAEEVRTATVTLPRYRQEVENYNLLWAGRKCTEDSVLSSRWLQGAEECGTSSHCDDLTLEQCVRECELLRRCYFSVWLGDSGRCERHVACGSTSAKEGWLVYGRVAGVAPADALPPGPSHHVLEPSLSWGSAAMHCARQGGRLCAAAELCKLASGSLELFGGAPELPEEHWVPVSDSLDDWVQVGSCNGGCLAELCVSYKGPLLAGLAATLGNGPLRWGSDTRKGNLFCCDVGLHCYADGYAASGGHSVTARSAEECQTQCVGTKGCGVFTFSDTLPLGRCTLSPGAVPLTPPAAGDPPAFSGPPRCAPWIGWRCSLGTPTVTPSLTQTLPLPPVDALPPVQVVEPGLIINRIELELSRTVDYVNGPGGTIEYLRDMIPRVLPVSHPRRELSVLSVHELPPDRSLLAFDVIGASQNEKAHIIQLLKRGTPPFDTLRVIRLLTCYEGVVCDSLLGEGPQAFGPTELSTGSPPPVPAPSLLPLYIALPLVVVFVVVAIVCWWRRRSLAGEVLPMQTPAAQNGSAPGSALEPELAPEKGSNAAAGMKCMPQQVWQDWCKDGEGGDGSQQDPPQLGVTTPSADEVAKVEDSGAHHLRVLASTPTMSDEEAMGQRSPQPELGVMPLTDTSHDSKRPSGGSKTGKRSRSRRKRGATVSPASPAVSEGMLPQESPPGVPLENGMDSPPKDGRTPKQRRRKEAPLKSPGGESRRKVRRPRKSDSAGETVASPLKSPSNRRPAEQVVSNLSLASHGS